MPYCLRILACAAAASLAGCFAFPERAEIRETRGLDVAGVQKIIVDTSNGRVRVRPGGSEDDGELLTTRFAGGFTQEDARRAAASIPVEVERDSEHPSILRVTATLSNELSHRSAGAAFELKIPSGPDLEIHTRNGKIEVEDARGDVVAHTSNGAVELRGVRGDVDVRTSNGTILTEDTEGDLMLRTSNGSVRARVSRLPVSAHVVTSTTNGSVRLDLPEDVSARISLRTSNGSITTDFDGANVAFVDRGRSHVEAEVNGAAGRVEVATSNGSVTCRLGFPPGP